MSDPHDDRLALSAVRCKITHLMRRTRKACGSTHCGKHELKQMSE